MKTFLLSTICVISLTVTTTHSAVVLAGWDVVGVETVDSINSTYTASGLYQSTLSIAGSDLTENQGNNAFNMRDWFGASATSQGAVDDNRYFSFVIDPIPQAYFIVDSIAWQFRRSSTGPTDFAIRSSLDGFSSDLATLNNTSVDTSTGLNPAFANLNIASGFGQSIEFRIYGWNAGGPLGTARIEDGANFGMTGLDFTVFGDVTVIPEPGTTALFVVGLSLIVALRRKLGIAGR